MRLVDAEDILIMLTSHYDAGEKWRRLHDEIKRQFDEQTVEQEG